MKKELFNKKGYVITQKILRITPNQQVIVINEEEPDNQKLWMIGRVSSNNFDDNLQEKELLFVEPLSKEVDFFQANGQYSINRLRRLSAFFNEEQIIPLSYNQWIAAINNKDVDSNKLLNILVKKRTPIIAPKSKVYHPSTNIVTHIESVHDKYVKLKDGTQVNKKELKFVVFRKVAQVITNDDKISKDYIVEKIHDINWLKDNFNNEEILNMVNCLNSSLSY